MSLKHTLLASGAFGGMTRNEQRLGRFIRDGEGHPAAAPTPAEEPAVDPFDAAFDAAIADPPAAGDPPAPAAGDPPAPAAGDPPAGDPPAPAAGDPPAPAPAPAAGDPPAPAPVTDPPAPAAPTADEILKGLTEALKSNQTPPAPTPVVTPTQEAPVYTEDEQAQLAEYEKNWPEIAKAETLRRRAEYADIFKYVFTEVAQYVQPMKDALANMGNTLHLSELKDAVPDYTPAVEADVTAWIDTQPSYLQAPMKQVMQGGTSEEVADLIGRYRAATGVTPAPAAPAPAAAAPVPAAPAAAPKTELSSAAKQAAESLAPVGGDRSAVPAGEETLDFESAFSKYAAAGG